MKGKKRLRDRLTYANVVATMALFLALGGSAIAENALTKNSVGSRQLKSKSVTTGKIANRAITGLKIAENSITGQNINMSDLGTVPSASSAASAKESEAVDGHAAGCPANTTLIRGICFDTTANPPVESPEEAADACATSGGWLPSPLELYAVRNLLNLGTGVGSDSRFTDEVYANTNAGNYRSVVVNGNGAISEVSAEGHVPERYICVYPLVR
jgi:hypothetical protein